MATARLNRLSYWYPRAAEPALREIDLATDVGITVVAGPSGGGKSTLLRIFNGLVPHFHGGRIGGSARVAGLDVIATPTHTLARKVGFVFQDPELQTVYDSVEREVAFGLENYSLPAGQMPGRVDEALALAGVQHLAGRRMRTLSGGERQRIALASVLAMRPEIVVLDEPTSQLDAEGARLVLDAVRGIAEDGRAVIVAEHRLDALVPAAAAILDVRDGRVQSASPHDWRPPAEPQRPPRAATPGAVAWTLSNLVAGYAGHPVLAAVDLSGRTGEVVVLRGPNGGGKTTLLRTISGLLVALSGRVERRPGRVAYLPQNPAAILHGPSVRSEIQVTLDRAHDSTPADEILAALGLERVAGRYPRDLSSGERQRAALAAVLAGRPRLVLLDEPTRGMDVAARDALTRLVGELRDRGSAVVLATHDHVLQEALADRVVDVCGGRAIEREVARW